MESRLRVIVLELLDAVDAMEIEVRNKVDLTDYNTFKENVQLKLAKISGLLEGRSDINFSVDANNIKNLDASSNNKYTIDEKDK